MKAEDILALLTDHFLNKYTSSPRKKKLYASDMGSEACKLELWRKLRGYPQQAQTPGTTLMFQQGENLEEQVADIIAEALEATGVWTLVDRQTSVEYRGITGKLDILIRHRISGMLIVIEVKSKRGNAFQYLTEPKTNNLYQTLFYVEATSADAGILVYVDREGSNFMKPFDVLPNKKALDKVIDEALLILEDETEPDCLTARVTRNQNKGPDSLSIVYPWQVTWCRDKECPCKRAIGNLPTGIVAKAKKDDDGFYTEITPLEPKYKKHVPFLIQWSKDNGWMR